MAEKYDVIIVGAGHNGLMVGAYLAKAGVKVCVLEHSEKVGGGVRTDEVTIPGFKHDICSAWHALLYPNPMFKDDELELFSRFGLKYVSPKTLTGVAFDDGSFFRSIVTWTRPVKVSPKYLSMMPKPTGNFMTGPLKCWICC